MWVNTKSVSLTCISFQVLDSHSNYYYRILWLLLSSQSTTHRLLDIPNWHPSLLSFSWKCPSHYLYSTGLEPWGCLWLMTCLHLYLTNQSLSPFSSTWKCFFPTFLYCSHYYLLLSYYWSFQTDFPESSLFFPLFTLPLPSIKSY